MIPSLPQKKSNPVDDKMKADMNAMNQLYNVSLSGKSTAFKSFNLNDKPLGSRYFMKSENDDEYVLIDNMKYHKTSKGKIDTNKYGLLYSAQGNLQEIDASNTTVTCIEEGGGEKCLEKFQNKTLEGMGTTTVEVEVLTDPTNPESTETKSISFASYKKMQCTAFPKKNGEANCKRYSTMFPEHCDTCDILDPDPLTSPSQEEINDMVDEELANNKDYQDGLNELNKLEEQVADMETFISGNGYETFYSRYSQPLNNFRKEEPVQIKTEYTYTVKPTNRLVIEDDVITATYVAGVTILGLCIFGIMFSKSAEF